MQNRMKIHEESMQNNSKKENNLVLEGRINNANFYFGLKKVKQSDKPALKASTVRNTKLPHKHCFPIWCVSYLLVSFLSLYPFRSGELCF